MSSLLVLLSLVMLSTTKSINQSINQRNVDHYFYVLLVNMNSIISVESGKLTWLPTNFWAQLIQPNHIRDTQKYQHTGNCVDLPEDCLLAQRPIQRITLCRSADGRKFGPLSVSPQCRFYLYRRVI